MEETRETAKYNESGLKIQRLHNHWLDVSKFREIGLLDKVKWKLDSIELELEYDAKKIDGNEEGYIDNLKEINKSIEGIDKKINLFKIKIANITEEELKNIYNVLIYKYLKDKEKILREIQQESGMGSKYVSSDEDEWD